MECVRQTSGTFLLIFSNKYLLFRVADSHFRAFPRVFRDSVVNYPRVSAPPLRFATIPAPTPAAGRSDRSTRTSG